LSTHSEISNREVLSEIGLRRIIRTAALIGGLFLFGFGGVATFVPMDSSAIAFGTLSVDSKRKTIQHLEGGIVEKIFVKENEKVKVGQILVSLQKTKARAELSFLKKLWVSELALKARLIAERDEKKEMSGDEELRQHKNIHGFAQIIDVQKDILLLQVKQRESQIAILGQQKAQLTEEIEGSRLENRSLDKQLKLIGVEIKDTGFLVDKGLAKKSRLLELQRREAEIQARKFRNLATISKAREGIIEAGFREAELRSSSLSEIAKSLQECEIRISELEQKIEVAGDELRRMDIMAPVSGSIVDMKIFSAGAVIPPGGILMDIVPTGEKFVVETRVSPSDIDVVRSGLNARIRFTAFSSRNVDPIRGFVDSVSGDRLSDPRTGDQYYGARIRLTPESEKEIGQRLHPGMQAEVSIVTGERTFLAYFIEPLFDSFRRSFSEN
jgi:HlyD family type I secretion membrane fusion protein